MNFKTIFISVAFILLLNNSHAQQKMLIHLDDKTKVTYGEFSKDSLKIVLQIKKEKELFPLSYFIKGKLLGDKTLLEVTIPDSLKVIGNSWSFSEYIETADNSNTYHEAKKYATFTYSPFDYDFKSDPPSADIYLIPYGEWNAIFKRADINFIFKKDSLHLITNFKILTPTPCVYSVFEQRYIGVFVLLEKIKMEFVKPKRSQPNNNKATITFN